LNKKYETLLILIAPIILGVVLYFLILPKIIVFGVPLMIYAIMAIIHFAPKVIYKDDMERAWNYLCDWWFRFRKEDISSLNARGFERYFGDDKFIAFVVYRGSIGSKAHLPLVAVVKTGSMEVVDWDDDPSDEKIKNPFIHISPYFVGTPSPSVKPELEPMLKGKIFKKKTKEENEENEEKEEGEEISD
jgi:hypothetical protein